MLTGFDEEMISLVQIPSNKPTLKTHKYRAKKKDMGQDQFGVLISSFQEENI